MTVASTPAPARTGRDLAFLAMGVTVVLWASAFVAIRAIGDVFAPGPLALGRLLVGALALTIVVVPTGISLPSRRTLGFIVGYGVLWFGAYNVALNAGERHVDAGTAALLVQLGPILIAIFAGFLFGEGFPRTLVTGVAVAFAGVVLISVGSESGGGPGTDLIGVLLCVAAAVLYAAGVLLQKPALQGTTALQATWLGCTIGAVSCLPFAPALVHQVQQASTAQIAGVVYLGVFPTAVAFTTWAYALARVGAGRASATTYLVPAMAIVLSWLWLSETPALLAFLGGGLCLLGVTITRLRGRPRRPAAADLSAE